MSEFNQKPKSRSIPSHNQQLGKAVKWLDFHVRSVQSVTEDMDLIEAMKAAIENPRLDRLEFDELQRRVFEVLSEKGNVEYLHSIGNLALLKSDDNAALNNSAFDVKRNMIISMDREGKYIPFCTKMVFLKYYSVSSENQLHFWGQSDRAAYLQAMNQVLAPYLQEPITMTEGEV